MHISIQTPLGLGKDSNYINMTLLKLCHKACNEVKWNVNEILLFRMLVFYDYNNFSFHHVSIFFCVCFRLFFYKSQTFTSTHMTYIKFGLHKTFQVRTIAYVTELIFLYLMLLKKSSNWRWLNCCMHSKNSGHFVHYSVQK
jgi:hypothetical protein